MYSGWSSRAPLHFLLSLLITEFFWDRADSFPLFAVGTSSSWSPTRLVLHTASQLLEVSKQLIILVPPSSAWFKIMGDPGILPHQLSHNRKFRREGRCYYAILQSIDTSSSCGTTVGPEILNFNKYISCEEIRLQFLYLAETTEHKVGNGKITKKCLLISISLFFYFFSIKWFIPSFLIFMPLKEREENQIGLLQSLTQFEGSQAMIHSFQFCLIFIHELSLHYSLSDVGKSSNVFDSI